MQLKNMLRIVCYINVVLKLTTKSASCGTNVKFSDQKSLPLVYSHA